MLLIFMLVVGYILSSLMTPRLARMLSEAGFIRPNYRQEDIPLGVGMVFALTILVVCPVVIWWDSTLASSLYISLFGIFSLTFLGLVDDTLGSRAASGLKGHLMRLVKHGELTTGALKAIMGGMVALSVTAGQYAHVFSVGALLQWFYQGLIIALSINSINLLDLRPGRAGKGFLVGAVVLLLVGWSQKELVPLAIVLGALLAYLPRDLQAKSMMGDTGANGLGVILGITSVWVLPTVAQLVLLAGLVLFHLYTEKYSLTKTIEKNKVLNYLDMLGR